MESRIIRSRNVWKTYNRFILWFIYILSIVIMCCDLQIQQSEAELFYVLCNGTLMFRLFGVWFLPWLLHVGCIGYIIYFYASLKYDFVNIYNSMLCLIPLAISFVTALHLVCFRPGRSKSQRACRVGVHALIGLCTVIIHYWLICFLIADHDIQSLLEVIYMFLYLIMILTPQFMTRGQAVMQAAREKQRLEEKCREEEKKLQKQERKLQKDIADKCQCAAKVVC